MQACFVDVSQRVFTTLMPRVFAPSQLWCEPQAFGVVGRELRVIPKQLGHRFFMAFIFHCMGLRCQSFHYPMARTISASWVLSAGVCAEVSERGQSRRHLASVGLHPSRPRWCLGCPGLCWFELEKFFQPCFLILAWRLASWWVNTRNLLMLNKF